MTGLVGFLTSRQFWFVDRVRVVCLGKFVEHWDVMQDDVSEADSLSKRPMWGDHFRV